MLAAVTAEVAEHGYPATTAAAIYRRARVSSRSFYEQFANKEACFLAAFDEGAERLVARVRAGWATGSETAGPNGAGAARQTGPVHGDRGQSAGDRLALLIRSYLGALRSHPDVARAFLVEIYAAGPRALERRQRLHQRFVDLAAEAIGADRTSEEGAFAVEAAVGAVTYLVTAKVALGRYDELDDLQEQLVTLAYRLVGARRPSRGSP